MSTKITRIITCPSCLHQFTNDKDGKTRRMMATLVEQGFGLREVGRIFNEHPETVKYWHKKIKSTQDTAEKLSQPTEGESAPIKEKLNG